jgi:hypothetical protein
MWTKCDKNPGNWKGRVFRKYEQTPLYTRFVEDIVGLDKKFIVVVPRYREYGKPYHYIKRRNYGEGNWRKLIKILLSIEEFKNFKIVGIGPPFNSHSLNSLRGYNDLTQIYVADYSAFAASVLANAELSIGTQSGGTVYSLHCGVPTFQWGHEKVRHRDEENVHGVPSEFCQDTNYNVDPNNLADQILQFWKDKVV